MVSWFSSQRGFILLVRTGYRRSHHNRPNDPREADISSVWPFLEVKKEKRVRQEREERETERKRETQLLDRCAYFRLLLFIVCHSRFFVSEAKFVLHDITVAWISYSLSFWWLYVILLLCNLVVYNKTVSKVWFFLGFKFIGWFWFCLIFTFLLISVVFFFISFMNRNWLCENQVAWLTWFLNVYLEMLVFSGVGFEFSGFVLNWRLFVGIFITLLIYCDSLIFLLMF